ncbi:MAG TPA: hypothetical protein VFN61_04415, partial [Acidimicrobiales bacterium]|nr:hypothetical protein [Acidimicrobiales bacterium]
TTAGPTTTAGSSTTAGPSTTVPSTTVPSTTVPSTTVPLPSGGQAPLPAHPAPGTATPPVPAPGTTPVAFLLPVVNEMNLRWQAESHFCFAMPSETGMTGTNSGDAHPRTVMFTVGTPYQPMPPLTLATRQAAVADLERYHATEIVVGPEAPSAPGWTPEGQAQLVVWVEWLLGQAPVQSHDIHISYIWKDLPPYEDIATGHVGYVAGEAHN